MTSPTYALPLNDSDRATLRLHAASIGKSPAQSDESLIAIYYGNPPKPEQFSGSPSTVTAEQVAEQLRKPVTVGQSLMKAYINGITFTELRNGEGVAIVHADAELVDSTEDEFEKQLFNDEIEDYLIPAFFKGMILFELKDGKTAFKDTEQPSV